MANFANKNNNDMDFKDTLQQLSDRVLKLKETIKTEEATKTALIMPFISALGYDVFNPMEVVPEMDCDLIKNRGDKIDYAIFMNDEPIMLIECKHWAQNLDLHSCQLQKYFVASKAKFGVLTNGVVYRFYTDLVKTNIMDTTPFLEINIESLKDSQIDELKKFHKSYFNIANILNTASELKYLAELKTRIKEDFSNPSADLVRILTKKVYEGTMTQKVIEQFTELVKRSLNNHINEVISERLNVAIKSTEHSAKEEPKIEVEEKRVEETPKVITTEEELQGFYIVRAIIAKCVDVKRIAKRDTASYFTILFDDNNRKPICKLHFNTKNKYIETFNKEKVGTKHSIEDLEEIYKYSDELVEIATYYANS